MTEDEAKGLKAGDVVLVRCKVLGTDHEGEGGRFYITCATIDETPQDFAAYVSAIHSVLHRPLEVGDRVRMTNDNYEPDTGTVRGLHDQFVWVVWDLDAPSTCLLAELERVQ